MLFKELPSHIQEALDAETSRYIEQLSYQGLASIISSMITNGDLDDAFYERYGLEPVIRH